MINIRFLKKYELIKAIEDIPNLGIYKGDIITVVKVGVFRFDNEPYADVKNKNGNTVDISRYSDRFDKIEQ